MVSTQPFPSVKTQFLINDGHDRTDRLAQANLRVSTQAFDLVLEYERRDGSAGKLVLPVNAVTQAFDAAGISPRPMTVKAFTCRGQTCRSFGPFTRRDTAEAVARGKGEWGRDAYVDESSYVAWRDPDGVLMGVQTNGEPVRLRETEPKDAAIEAALSKLEPAERAVLEAALAR